MSDTDLLARFLFNIRVERGLSQATESAYRYQIGTYLRATTLASATKETVLQFLSQKRKIGLKTSTLFNLTLAIRQFHRFLFAEKFLGIDPTANLTLPKFQHNIPEPLSVIEMDALLTPIPFLRFTALRTQTMIDVAYNLGLRVSELVNLKLEHVDMVENRIHVRRGKGGRDRKIPFGEALKRSLEHYLRVRSSQPNAASRYLFLSARGRPISRGTFWWLLNRWAKRAGINGRVSPHQLRHSFATHLLVGGANLRGIQAALGHRDIRQTQIYSHVDMTFLKETLQHHPRFSK